MRAADIESCFNHTFASTYQTELKGGADEPLYLPSKAGTGTHMIYYREDFASSALHEIAHWLIAGEERRKLMDYGYHYDQKRDRRTQREFEELEARPQALEWILSEASGVSFRVSCDNFEVKTEELDSFRQRVKQEVLNWLSGDMPVRTRTLIDAFINKTGQQGCLHSATYKEHPR